MQKSDSVLRATEYEIKPQIIKMAAANPFRGDEMDNPYRHIKWFTMLCNTVQQDVVPLTCFRWNLFPYSLAEEARRWFVFASFEVKGNWDDLMKKFCEWFFPLSKVQYNHTGYIFGKESAGDIIQKLFEEKEEEIDLDEVLEVKRIMRMKSESSPYAHIAQVYAIGSDQGEGNPSPTPCVDCMIDRIKCCNVLCDVGAHVSVMSSKVYVEVFNETPNLDATIIKLIMGDGRLIKPLGVIRNLNVAIAGKEIPTDFFL